MIRRFVLRYIREHMAHDFYGTRCAIFAAVADGMRKEFTEDNESTLRHVASEWLGNAFNATAGGREADHG